MNLRQNTQTWNLKVPNFELKTKYPDLVHRRVPDFARGCHLHCQVQVMTCGIEYNKGPVKIKVPRIIPTEKMKQKDVRSVCQGFIQAPRVSGPM